MTVPLVAAEVAWRTLQELRRKKGVQVAAAGIAVGGAMVALAAGVVVSEKIRGMVDEAKSKVDPRTWLDYIAPKGGGKGGRRR